MSSSPASSVNPPFLGAHPPHSLNQPKPRESGLCSQLFNSLCCCFGSREKGTQPSHSYQVIQPQKPKEKPPHSSFKPSLNPSLSAQPQIEFANYDDNWSWYSKGHLFPTMPLGVHAIGGFAVPDTNGDWDPAFDMKPGTQSAWPPGCDRIAIGGWNASNYNTPHNGMYYVMTEPLKSDGSLSDHQQNLLNNVVSLAESSGANTVVFDYENYANSSNPAPRPDPKIYDTFLMQLGNALHAKGKKLEICISPSGNNPNNRDYYSLSALYASGCVDAFQTMCYDYWMGKSGNFVVGPNSDVVQSLAYLKETVGEVGGDSSKFKIGAALYGLNYSVQPGMSVQQITDQLNAKTLQGTYKDATNPPIGVDGVFAATGATWSADGQNWVLPAGSPWQLIQDNSSPPNQYYYNSSTGNLLYIFSPDSVRDFAKMVNTNFPNTPGIFAWDADDDYSGKMMQLYMNSFQAYIPAPSVATCNSEIISWLGSLQNVSPVWIQAQRDFFTKTPPQSIEDIQKWYNGLFQANGKQDFYIQTGMLLGTPDTNLINQLELLFSSNFNLLSLNLSVPEHTFADEVYARISGWQPNSQGGQALKGLLIAQFQPPYSQGSDWTQAEITSWAYNIPASEYPNLSQSDSTDFTNITGAWL